MQVAALADDAERKNQAFRAIVRIRSGVTHDYVGDVAKPLGRPAP